MKAIVKATGEIISLDEKSTVLDANPCNFNSYEISELEILYENTKFPKDYWEKLLHQYAGMAMQGILSNPESELDYKDDETLPQALAECVAKVAHALVEKMKEERK